MNHVAAAPPGVAILMYHSIARSTTATFREFTVDPILFEEHVAALVDADCHFVTVQEVPAVLAGKGDANGRTAVAISIDDALADAATGGSCRAWPSKRARHPVRADRIRRG